MMRAAEPRLDRMLWWARMALLWEQAWPRLWPLVSLIGLFSGLVLLDVLPMLPGWAHALALVAFLLAAVALAVYAAPGFKVIPKALARHRLERDSRLDHRPLLTLDDRIAAGTDDPLAEALWQRHRTRTAAAIKRLHLGFPDAGLAKREPWGIRAAVLLLLVIGLIIGRDDADVRLAHALDPGLAGAASEPATVEIWITPPAYTGAAPLYLSSAPGPSSENRSNATKLSLPTGSTVLARVTGVRTTPTLVIGEDHHALEPIENTEANARAFRIERTIHQGSVLAVHAGGRGLARWPIAVLADATPTIALTDAPGVQGNGVLTLPFKASDDYGIAAVTASLHLADADPGPAANADDDVVTLTLPLNAIGARELTGTGVHDLTDHAWAGRDVLLVLNAVDTAGQTGTSAAYRLRLPERSFSHPVAKVIAAERKRLFHPQPPVRISVATILERLSRAPEQFGNDTVVSLALAVAMARLRLDRSDSAVPSVRALLWDTALHLDLGDVPFAQRELDRARQRLAEALRRDAPQDEIERLMDAMEQALDRYLQALAAELARRGDHGPPLADATDILGSQDLHDMLDMARNLARSGAREGARQMLSQLQRLLDTLRSGLNTAGEPYHLREARDLMRALRTLSERQQTLLDETFQALRETRDGAKPMDGTPPRDAQALAREQQALRKALGDLMLRLHAFLGSIPAPLGDADQAMRDARNALGQRRLGEAVPSQGAALEALGRGLEAARQGMAERIGSMIGLRGPGDEGEGGEDIFGRASGESSVGLGIGHLAIPDAETLNRARAILEELRRRASERNRPQPELDYIERLLQRFR